jgi:precorrin-2 dehydrogenase / sirohydrochlorin ferrochelatase
MGHRFPDKEFMPVAIDVALKKILLIGGGRIALQKIEILSRYARNIHVLAPDILDEIKSLRVIRIIQKEYHADDLEGAFLVYACTNISSLNEHVRNDCASRGILINVVDNPALCDFVTPAVYKRDNLSVAVTSNSESVRQSIAVRNRIREILDHDPIGKI